MDTGETESSPTKRWKSGRELKKKHDVETRGRTSVSEKVTGNGTIEKDFDGNSGMGEILIG